MSVSTAPTSGTSRTTIAALALAELFTLGALTTAAISLPLHIADLESPREPETILAIVLAAGGAATMLGHPLFGWLSDRTHARSGHRTAWIIGGAVVATPAFLAIPHTDSVGMLTLAWVVVHGAQAATIAALYGGVTNVAEKRDWERTASWFAAAATGSIVLGAGAARLLPKEATPLFSVLPIAALVVVVACGLHLRAVSVRRHAAGAAASGVVDGLSETVADAPSGYWRFWTQRLLSQAAWITVTFFGVNLLMRRDALPKEDATSAVATAAVIAALTGALSASYLARPVARRIGPRAGLWLGLALVVVANLVMSFATTPLHYLVSVTIAAIGVGIFTAIDLSLVLLVIRPGTEGRYLGLFSVARTLPGSLVPAVAPIFFAMGSDLVGADRSQNFAAFYIAGAVAAVFAAVLVRTLPIRSDAQAPSAESASPVSR